MKGVNLGTWLVLERWLIPSVFEGTDAEDEYTFMQQPGAKERITTHRETFITEEDWQWLARNGIEFVRLPVGYWVLKSDPPFINAKKQLDWAFEMAEKYSIKILLDIHGIKGSQNGEMHSGKMGKVDWWKYRYESLDTLMDIAKRYRNSTALWGVEIVNEPKAWGNYFKLLWYYREAYKRLQTVLNPGTYTVFHDGFVAPLFSGALWQKKDYPVAMDSHYYQVFSKILVRMTPEKYDAVRGILFKLLIATAQWSQPVIIGEWSSVLPQPMFKRTPQETHFAMLIDTVARQQQMYQAAMATAFWNYKAEGRGMYHYRSLIEDNPRTP